MKTRNYLICVLFMAALTQPALAGSEKAGTTAANFLTFGNDAAILGHGGAGPGLSGDLGLLSWNVASLGWLHETEIEFSHASLQSSTAQEYLAVGGRLGQTGARWSFSGLYQSEGSFEGRDAFNNSTGSFNVSSFAAGGHVAYPFAGIASIGAGAKWVDESLGATTGGGVTFDAGVQVHAGMFGLGFAAQNAFGKMRFDGTPYDFPTNYGVGVSVNHPQSGLKVAFDANFPTAYYQDLRGGVEWRWRDAMAIRTGYRAELGAPSNEQLSGPTFGVGAGVYGMWIDYGYVVSGDNAAEHRISLSLRPGRLNLGHSAMDDATPANSETHVTEPKPQTAATTQSAGAPATKAAAPAAATQSSTTTQSSATTSGATTQSATTSGATTQSAHPATQTLAKPATSTSRADSTSAAKPKTATKKPAAKSTKSATKPGKAKTADPFDAAIDKAASLKPAVVSK